MVASRRNRLNQTKYAIVGRGKEILFSRLNSDYSVFIRIVADCG